MSLALPLESREIVTGSDTRFAEIVAEYQTILPPKGVLFTKLHELSAQLAHMVDAPTPASGTRHG